MDVTKIKDLLADPFEEHDIEWRVQQSGVSNKQKPWVMVIPYITNRAIQQRLDDVLGLDGWENVYQEASNGKGYLCGLKIRIGDKWVTKWDGAEYTNIEPLKGALSGAMKRTAVQFGIGRYLYSLESEFATCSPVNNRFECDGEYIRIPLNKQQKNGPKMEAQWFPPQLPDWALPKAKFDKYLEAIESAELMESMREAYNKAYKYAEAVNRIDIRDKAIAIKDRKKAELEKLNQAEAINKNKKFLNWINTKISDLITSAENESILNLNHKKLLQEVKGHCRANKIDATNFVSQVNEAHKQALINLRN